MPSQGHKPASVRAAPFLKWAGGKHSLLAQYERLFPAGPVRAYFEPFVGSGAVFFCLRARGFAECYHLSDISEELINVYRAVRDRVDDLIARLGEHQRCHHEDHFYAVRDLDRDPSWPDGADGVERAARMIYLNRTCYNGLWRVNSKGEFNVPLGRYRRPRVLNEPRLRAASEALAGVRIDTLPFEDALAGAQAGDFVYLDPPYVPLSATSSFTSYNPNGFGAAEQDALAHTFRTLDARGCRVMLSNSDTPLVRALYAGFRVETVRARRHINSRADGRGPLTELVVLNYGG